MIEKKLIKVKLDQIIPYENNPRKNEKTIDIVSKSIKQTGYNNPIIVDENMVILAGHTRRLALIKNGIKEAEVLQVSGLSEEKKKKFRLLDNKVAEYATWDSEKLAKELYGLDWDDLIVDWGLKGPEIEEEEETYKYVCPECGFHFNA